MKTEHLYFMLEINRLRSISSAARSLHIGQTRLSSIVKTVEEEVGYPIFMRTPKGVVPTMQGERFLNLAWEINVKFEALQMLKDRTAKEVPTIYLLLCPSISLRLTLPLTQKFQRYDLQSSLVFKECTSQAVREGIVKQSGNVGVAYLTDAEYQRWLMEKDVSPVNVQILSECELVLLVSKNHRLAQREVVDIQELANERLARTRNIDNEDVMWQIQDPFCKHITGFASMDIMCQAIYEDGYIGLISSFVEGPDSIVDTERFRFIRLENVKRENHLYIAAVTNSKRRLLYQEEILIQCIQDYFREAASGTEEG